MAVCHYGSSGTAGIRKPTRGERYELGRHKRGQGARVNERDGAGPCVASLMRFRRDGEGTALSEGRREGGSRKRGSERREGRGCTK